MDYKSRLRAQMTESVELLEDVVHLELKKGMILQVSPLTAKYLVDGGKAKRI